MAVTCPNCRSRTRYEETCQWCSKPLAVHPRAPTEAEADRHVKGSTVRKAQPAGQGRHYITENDPLLLEIELVQAKYGLGEKRIEKILKYTNIIGELLSGRQLRHKTRERLRLLLREYQ